MGVLIIFVGSTMVLPTLLPALRNQPRALGDLSHAGFNCMLNIALLWCPRRRDSNPGLSARLSF